MKMYRPNLVRIVSVCTLLPFFSYNGLADKSDLSATELAYFEGSTKQPETFNSIPISHITPQLKKVSLALDTRLIDTTVTNQTMAMVNSVDTFSMKGHTVSPFVALSLSRLGVGINFESGERALESTLVYSNGFGDVRESKMKYSGLGIYLYFIPFQKVGSWRLSTVIGSKLLNAKHDLLTTRQEQTFNEVQTDYSVTKTNYGLNFRYQMSPKIAVIPWVDYLKVDINEGSQVMSTVFDADLDLFWLERPDTLYGIDVTYRVGQAELHLGGAISLLNSVGQSTVESQTYKIDDNTTFNISLSYDFKD